MASECVKPKKHEFRFGTLTAEEAARPDAQYLSVIECAVCPFRTLTSRAPLTGKDKAWAKQMAARLDKKYGGNDGE